MSYDRNISLRKEAAWEEKSFEDLTESAIIGLVKNKREQGEQLPYRYIKMNNITRDNCFDDSSTINVDATEEELTKYKLLDNDFLFNTRNSYELVGKNCLYRSSSDEPDLYNNNIMRVRFHPEIDSAFVGYAFSSGGIVSQLELIKQGTTNVSAIYYKSLKNILIQYPPLPEQKRIVAILDEAFAGISQAVANAEKNLANARELFESYLNNLFAGEGSDWERCSLGELLERKWITGHLDGNHGGDYPRKNEFIDSGIPYISAKCIKNERVDFSISKYLSPDRAEMLRKGIACNNDVLFAHNATVGPVAVLDTKEEKIILGTSLTYYRCDEKYILPEYLAHYMRSPEFTAQYRQVMRQSTRNQVPITKQRTFMHIIPALKEQRDISKKLDGLSKEMRMLETIYQQKLTALTELKQSLLQKAFAGELTAKPATRTREGISA